jgi:hypothetical protein
MYRIIFFLISVLLLSSCATSKITAFRDPAFATKHFSSLVVFAQGMALDSSVEVERMICNKVAPTPCKSGKSVLPPTRQYTGADVAKYLEDSGAEAVLIIALVADRSNTQYFGTFTASMASASATSSGTINFYGNNAFWNGTTNGSASGQSVSMPVYGYSRVAFGQLGLFDRLTGNIAWIGEIRVEGQGALNTTDDAFINSATSKIATELKTSGLVH